MSSGPDPLAVGPAILAWYALHGELEGDPAEVIGWAADAIAGKLGAFGRGVINPLPPAQAEVAIEEARLLLQMVAEIFGQGALPADDEAALAFKASLVRRRGRPLNTGKLAPQSLAWWGAALEVERLIAGGMLQKTAVGEVAEQRGVKDSVVAGWCRERRRCLAERQEQRAGISASSEI